MAKNNGKKKGPTKGNQTRYQGTHSQQNRSTPSRSQGNRPQPSRSTINQRPHSTTPKKPQPVKTNVSYNKPKEVPVTPHKASITPSKTSSKKKHWIFKILSVKNIVSVIILGLLFFLCNKKLDLTKTLIIVSVVAFFDFIIFYFKRGVLWRKIKACFKRMGVLNSILVCGLTIGIFCVLIGASFATYIVLKAPKFDPDELYSKESSVIYASDGQLIAKIGREKRERVSYEELPQVLIDAIIATEDSRFFQHNGIDLPRFTKATIGQILGKAGAGGGSTISMQVIKNSLTSKDQTLTRKFTDIYLAVFKLEKQYTKEQILEYYVNDPYLGSGGYGVEQACQAYFGKSVKDITLPEAALIAGLFQAPSAFDPLYNPETAYNRRNTVLNLMYMHGYITDEERKLADAVPIKDMVNVENRTSSSKYQGFIDLVLNEVEKKTGQSPYVIPMEIFTTMDIKKQNALNTIYENFKFKDDVVQAGVAVTNTKTGAIVAIGNGRNRTGERTFNFATQSRRQIGSAAKPLYDYAPGIEYLNWSTATRFVDEPHGYTGGGGINNWDGRFLGLQSLKEAVGLSRNIPALKAYQKVGSSKSYSMISKLGLTPELEGGAMTENHALGAYTGQSPLDVAAAYAAFGNKGYYNEPYSVSKIIYRETGEVENYKSTPVKAMSDSTAYIMTQALIWGVKYGLAGSASVSGVQVAAKTGTTNFDDQTYKNYKLPSNAVNDYWMAMYSSDYSIGIWFGYEEITSKYYNTLGQNNHTRFFSEVAKKVFSGTKAKFTKPSSVIEVKIEKDSIPAMLPSANTPESLIVTEYYKKGTEPTAISPRFANLNNVTNLTSALEGNTITLKWDYTAPDYTTDEYILEKAATVYKKPEEGLKYRQKKDAELLGDIIFNVYQKMPDGSLTKLAATKDNTYVYTATSASSYTFVVKPTYTLLEACESSGAETTIVTQGGGEENIFTLSLNVEDHLIINTANGESYVETTPIIAQDATGNVIDPTNYTVEVTYSKNNLPVTSAELATPGEYIVTYNVTFHGHTQSINRYISVQ